MRALLVVMLLGCGRLGFDDVTPGDAPGVAILPNICNARLVGTVPLAGELPTKVRAAALSSGHAVAIETAANNVHVVRVDNAGAIISTHLPFGGGGYQLQGISQIGDRPFVYVFTAGSGYIKMLVPDWNGYDTGPNGEQRTMDPQQALAPDGTNAVYGLIAGGQLGMASIDAAGASSGDVTYAPAATSASFASSPNTIRVVAENAGTCETFAIQAGGSIGEIHVFAPCFEPLLATLGDNTGAVLHRTAADGPLAIHAIPSDPAAPGSTTVLEIATNPRIAKIAGAIWVAYLRTDGEARLIRFDDGVVTMQDFAPIASAFDLLASGAFWVDSAGQLRTGDPCP